MDECEEICRAYTHRARERERETETEIEPEPEPETDTHPATDRHTHCVNTDTLAPQRAHFQVSSSNAVTRTHARTHARTHTSLEQECSRTLSHTHAHAHTHTRAGMQSILPCSMSIINHILQYFFHLKRYLNIATCCVKHMFRML